MTVYVNHFNKKVCEDKIFFMQINKVASRSLMKALTNTSVYIPNHAASEPLYLEDFGDIKFKFSFAFVRNPFDRAVSCWQYGLKRHLHNMTFVEFVKNLVNENVFHHMYHISRPQWKFICIELIKNFYDKTLEMFEYEF